MSARRRYGDRTGPLAIAHRGGAGLAPENTLDAFRRSYALGLRYLETDVRRTADGELVAFHDATLGRVTALRGRVGRYRLSTLRTTAVLGGGGVLSLRELLAAFPDACFTVDVKEASSVATLAALLRETDSAHRVCVAGMRESWLAGLRRLAGPELSTALCWQSLARLVLSGPRVSLAGRFAHVPLAFGRLNVATDELIARSTAAGVRVIVWTVDDPVTMHRVLDAGAAGIITDRPDLLREVLIGRGQWPTPDSYDSQALSLT